MDADPSRVFDLMGERFLGAKHLDPGKVQQIQPTALVRYEPGEAMIIQRVTVERDRVRLALHKTEPGCDNEPASNLTVKWPVPFSKEFTERRLVDDVIEQFVQPR